MDRLEQGEARATREERRAVGKREARRQARRNVERVLELSGAGLSPPKIAASVGLNESAVREILELARRSRRAS